MSIIAKLIEPVTSLVSEFVEDKDKANEISFRLATLASEQATSIVKAEAQSEHWIVASWRPILMLVITSIVAVHYLVFPLIQSLGGPSYMIELPQELWTLLQIGVGGYVVGRSGEKMVKEYKR